MEKQKGTRATATRGRPQYRPTLKQRETVEQMKFCGESENTISRSLGIDVGTLRKHFAEELHNGHANRRREVIGYLFEAAAGKNVAAIKKLEEMGRASGAADAVKARETKAKEPKRGKKEEQKIAAQKVDGKFAPPPAPKLVVDNR